MEEIQKNLQKLVPVFNGDDYEIWSIKMRTLLMSRDLWDVVEKTKPKNPMDDIVFTIKDGLRSKDMSALYMLQMSVTDSIFFRIARATSAKQAWDILKAEYGETERSRNMRKGFLGMMYENLEMEEEESVDEFIEKMMGLVNRLRFYGMNISDDEIIFKILRRLPSRFHESVSFIRSSNDLKITDVACILRADEWKQKCMTDEEASRGKQWCEFCRKSNHKTSECYSKNKKGRG